MRYQFLKYTLLLASMCLLFVVRILTREMPMGYVATDLCVALVVMAGLSATCTRRKSRILSLVFGIPPLALTLWFHIHPAGQLNQAFILHRAAMSLFLGFIIITILQDLIEQREVRRDAIVGAFCGYILLGTLWTELYCWADLVVPGAFQPGAGISPHVPSDIRWDHLMYFSFVTLTTVGYGDITPSADITRLLACLEAICGQFYLGVLVAGMVGIRVGQLASAQPPKDANGPRH